MYGTNRAGSKDVNICKEVNIIQSVPVKCTSFSYMWQIPNIMKQLKDKEAESVGGAINVCNSPAFAAETKSDQWKFYLSLSSFRHIDDTGLQNQYLSVYLYINSGCCIPKSLVKFNVVKKDSEGHCYNVLSFELHARLGWTGERVGVEKFMKQSEISTNDKLTVWCQITVLPDNAETGGLMSNTLQKDVKRMLTEKLVSDLTLLTDDGREFPVHRSVLSARSDVFKAMFTADMKEKSETHISISEIRSDVLEEVLTYIYTGDAPHILAMARELLHAADMYNLEELAVKCDDEILRQLTIFNACDTLAFADRYRRQHQKDKTLEFIASRSAAITQTNYFKNMQNVGLLKDIVVALSKR